MTNPIPWSFTGKSLVFMHKGKTTIISKGANANFDAVAEALKKGDWDAVLTLANLRTAIVKVSEGRVKVLDDNTVYVDGKMVNGVLIERILEMLNQGYPITPMLKFLDNVQMNPTESAKEELWKFIEHTSLPLTDDGHFLAYKIVRGDYMDCYTGTFDNHVGKTPEMPREDVDPDRNITCSRGLHVCSENYLPHYGSSGRRIVVAKVNPKDVVSIPTDYNNSKMRVCRYEVVDELNTEDERIRSWFTPDHGGGAPVLPVDTGNDSDADFEDDDFEDDDFDDSGWSDDDSNSVTDDYDDEYGAFGDTDDEEGDLDAIVDTLTGSNETSKSVSADSVEAELDEGKLAQIRKVRKMGETGFTRTAIADATGLSRRQVGRILDGEAWKNVK